MSRPKKMHKPLKGDFNSILGAVAMGTGKGKQAAKALQARSAAAKPATPKIPPKS